MADQWGRMIAGSAALAVLWIAVYWAWEPSPPPITYGSSPGVTSQSDPGAPPSLVDSKPVAPAASEIMKPAPKPVDPPAPAVPQAIPPEFTMYRVQPNDTLSSISKKFYGTGDHAPAIAKANPFKDPQRLKAGDEIRVPRDLDNIQGRDTGPAVSPPSPVTPPAAPAPTEKTYVVKPGDTLSSISKKQYGTVKYADLIYEANRQLLNSPDDIREGQTLKIPPKPSEGPQQRDGRS
jgi:nucleoid-associated protein YgaU